MKTNPLPPSFCERANNEIEVREFEAIVPAGHLFPTHPDKSTPFKPAEMTEGMRAVEDYAKLFAKLTIGCDITVAFGKQPSRESRALGVFTSFSARIILAVTR